MNITSPATGRVTKVTDSTVSIFLNPLGSHIVYSPFQKKIEVIRKKEGTHHIAFSKKASSNTRVLFDYGLFLITVYGGFLTRNIIQLVEEGQEVFKYSIIASLDRGSQVDITGNFTQIKVKKWQKVYANKTVIGIME